MLKIGIIGGGIVGSATKLFRCQLVNVVVYDTDSTKCDPPGTTLDHLCNADLIFIAVPTPSNKDGNCDTSIIETVVDELNKTIDSNKNIIVRSTVAIGTCDQLNVNFMPEFLTERNWSKDFRNNNYWICGLKDKDDVRIKILIMKLIDNAYKCGKIKYNNIIFCSNKEAELIKYMRNSFLAMKVGFCNEIYNYCHATDIDYNNIRDLFILDHRIEESHTEVPGHRGLFGFGGKCFPKDTMSLRNQMKTIDPNALILDAVIRSNEIIQETKNNDGHLPVTAPGTL